MTLRLLAPLAALAALLPALRAADLGFTRAVAPDSAVVLRVPADYVAFDLDVQIASDVWLERFDGLLAAQKLLGEAAIAEGFELHVARPVTMRPEYSKQLVSSFGPGENAFQPGAALRLLAPLAPDSDPVASIRRLRVFVEKIKLPKNTRLAAQACTLALKDPESRRADLLKKIAAHLDATSGLGGARPQPGDVTVRGLDGPLQLVQLDAGVVGLFLPFEAGYERD